MKTRLILLFILILTMSSCKKWFVEKYYKYSIEQRGDLTNLFVIYYDDNIFGIDTVNMRIQAHIKIEDMSFGGIAKLPNGGIVVTHHRRTSNNNWGEQMYIIDKECNLKEKIDICPSPIAPNVYGNIICVGSSAIEEGLKYKFQIYDANNYKLLKDYEFRAMLSAWEYRMYDNEVYLPIEPQHSYKTEYETSYIVKINSTTGDTTSIRFDKNIAYKDAFDVFKENNILYICSLTQKKIIKYNIENKKILAETTLTDYPQIVDLGEIWNVSNPVVKDKYIYAFLGGGYDTDIQRQLCAWVKLSAEDLTLLDVKKIDKYPGVFLGDAAVYAGNYYTISALDDNKIDLMLIDYTTGEIVKSMAIRK